VQWRGRQVFCQGGRIYPGEEEGADNVFNGGGGSHWRAYLKKGEGDKAGMAGKESGNGHRGTGSCYLLLNMGNALFHSEDNEELIGGPPAK